MTRILRREGASREEIEDILSTLYTRVISFMRADPFFFVLSNGYLIRAVKRLLIDRYRRNREKARHQRFAKFRLTGDDLTSMDLAERGIGNFPSLPENKIYLRQVEQQFGRFGGSYSAEVEDLVREVIYHVAGSYGSFKLQGPQEEEDLVGWYMDKYGGEEYEQILDRVFSDPNALPEFYAYRNRVLERLTKRLQRHEAAMRKWEEESMKRPKYILAKLRYS